MSTLLERLGLAGLNPAKAAAESYAAKCAREVSAVLAGKAEPVRSERVKVRVRKTKTHYLDGEEQRRVKKQLREHHGVILSLILQGVPVGAVAALYGVTDVAIYNRQRTIAGLLRKRQPPAR